MAKGRRRIDCSAHTLALARTAALLGAVLASATQAAEVAPVARPAAAAAAAPTRAVAAVRVIVHPSRAGGLSKAVIGAIYLKQKLLWDDGQVIVPINHASGSAPREHFSEQVFGQDSRRLAGYWNQRYFEAGEFPPATLASDDAVVRFVAGHPNAIGYITDADPDERVAVVLEIP